MTVKIKEFTGKVISQELFFNWEGKKVDVPTVTLKPDTCGYYYIKAVGNEQEVRNWRRGWEELEIVKVADGLYHLHFYAVSAPRFDIRTDAFMTIEMTKEQVIEWHDNDVWFSEGYHYIIRRAGQKFYKIGGNQKRCIKCQYLQSPSATECDRGC
jgi:hypothetical protein